ncbi:helix-turn-helix transcriptional regulator [Yinghuangia seranimata]|uniref:helix-turn-helix transcriptional regulator n=1 Tax=Yinghuangia seranimata TaxID=408067 RepID=UPI00248AB79B|nr:helix-turn-helix transcriptional regulator [Yinghuangia seranimata]MDI2128737.1 helix-turn-helix transcriptional regulator [Yinghuangia seranimata]
MHHDDDLGTCLRAWRDRLPPAAVGLPEGPRRRAPGLRRQELATLAGLSVEYLARLEQGRAGQPSTSILAPLARALRLTDEERDHLYRLAGHASPAVGHAAAHITPGLQRIVDRLGDAAVMAVDRTWTVVLANPLAVALFGDLATGADGEHNVLRRHFADGPTRLTGTPEERAAFEAGAVADLRASLARFPGDPAVPALVRELQSLSPRFAELWAQRDIATSTAQRKTVDHPQAGRLHLDCDVLEAAGSSLRLVVYSAAPGTADQTGLAFLAAVGTQAFDEPHSA